MCERKVVEILPDVTLRDLLLSFQEVLARADMFAHHHVQREPLSVRQRMSDVLARIQHGNFAEFTSLFTAEEGRMGVVVTFLAILELIRESLLDIVQAEPYAPIHIKARSVEPRPIEHPAAEHRRLNRRSPWTQ
jgi:segregation and condensation protein A